MATDVGLTNGGWCFQAGTNIWLSATPVNRYKVLILGRYVTVFLDFVNVAYVKSKPVPTRTVGLVSGFCRCGDDFGFGAQ